MGLPIYSLSQHEMAADGGADGPTYRRTDMLNIPLLLSVPGIEAPMVMEITGGQVDLLPTIANLLGISVQEQIHFGQDLLNHDEQSAAGTLLFAFRIFCQRQGRVYSRRRLCRRQLSAVRRSGAKSR